MRSATLASYVLAVLLIALVAVILLAGLHGAMVRLDEVFAR